jgi:hypothetical protein
MTHQPGADVVTGTPERLRILTELECGGCATTLATTEADSRDLPVTAADV